ncbi:alpha/beta hydrolase [Marinicella sediminis]|uniref:Alpha/beta hydrolase n=1 Tax=Marinicella sediminis TaxID=1792834 RepID=A0ABV7J826_9GAMM|nr:alpha/beta hydrolase-fold protein [Marinicella sediminis]
MSSDQLHTFTCLLMLWSALAFAETENTLPASPVAKPFAIGETVSFNSEILQQQRTINVYLPAGYQTNPSQKYPVIYLLDGSADEDFIHLAGLVQFNAFSWINKVPESIVIGIANIDRKQDFTHPTSIEADRKAFPTTGQSARFIRFIRDELQPLVSQRYRTTAQNTLIGQSLGGSPGH